MNAVMKTADYVIIIPIIIQMNRATQDVIREINLEDLQE